MNHKQNRILLLFSFLIISLTLQADVGTDYTIDGMVGAQPVKLCWVLKQLIADKELPKKVMLLHGKPGNGKSTIARKIAELSNREFLQLDGPSVVGTYVGQGAQNITNIFAQAREIILESKFTKKVIIFMDEIDSIASNNTTEFRGEHKASTQQLWLELDKIKNDPHIFVIFATNHLDRLDKTFLDRLGGNVIEIKMPDLDSRKALLTHYLVKSKSALKKELIDKLAQKTKGLSTRSIEDFVADAAMMADVSNKGIVTDKIVWQALKQTKSKFVKTDDPDSEKRLQKINTIVSIVSGVLGITVNGIYLTSLFSKPVFEFVNRRNNVPTADSIATMTTANLNALTKNWIASGRARKSLSQNNSNVSANTVADEASYVSRR